VIAALGDALALLSNMKFGKDATRGQGDEKAGHMYLNVFDCLQKCICMCENVDGIYKPLKKRYKCSLKLSYEVAPDK
jgi:hypothetical protein